MNYCAVFVEIGLGATWWHVRDVLTLPVYILALLVSFYLPHIPLCRLLCHLDIPLDVDHLFAYWPDIDCYMPYCFFLYNHPLLAHPPFCPLINQAVFLLAAYTYISSYGSLRFHHPSLPFQISYLLLPVFIIMGNHKSSRASAMACSTVIHTMARQAISSCPRC